MMPESALSVTPDPLCSLWVPICRDTSGAGIRLYTFQRSSRNAGYPTFRGVNLAYAAAFSGLAIAACAAYDKQARAAGTFGLVALCAGSSERSIWAPICGPRASRSPGSPARYPKFSP